MSLCCLLAASSRCPGFSLRSLDADPGMRLLAKSIQRWLGAFNTGLWACPFVLSEFHIREKQNAGKPEFSFCSCSCLPERPPPQTPAVPFLPVSPPSCLLLLGLQDSADSFSTMSKELSEDGSSWSHPCFCK